MVELYEILEKKEIKNKKRNKVYSYSPAQNHYSGPILKGYRSLFKGLKPIILASFTGSRPLSPISWHMGKLPRDKLPCHFHFGATITPPVECKW